jgi:DNA-binding transcriptional LysR family regulator
MSLNIRRLQHYIVLAQEKSFLKAADKVHLSQPAMSRSIQSLEAELGVVLVDRTARNFMLTSAGKIILERARRIIHESRCLERDVALLNDHGLGEVVFGMGTVTAAICIEKVLARLAELQPGLRIRTDVNSWSVLWDRLHDESLDFFVLDRKTVPRSDTVTLRQLSSHKAGWHVGAGHPLLKKETLTSRDLHDYSFAFSPLPESIRLFIRRWLRVDPIQDVRCALECNDFAALKAATARSREIVLFATGSSVREEVRSGVLHKLTLTDAPDIDFEMTVVHLAHRTLSPEAEITIGVIADLLNQAK